MRKAEEVEVRLEDWLACWEGWAEEVEEGRGVSMGRRLEGRGGEKGAKRNKATRLQENNCIVLAHCSDETLDLTLNIAYGYQRSKKSQEKFAADRHHGQDQ